MIGNRYIPASATTGGMGEIIECKDVHLDRKVVIKKLHSGVEQRRIIDEYKALAKLRSKHVVQLFDLLEINNGGTTEVAIVLEFIEGQDLQLSGYSPNFDYLKIVWQIAGGLRDIHAAGVIHRDIKPNNIRIDQEGVVKILDFGLARSNDEAKTKTIIGTPVFMAPELWEHGTVHFSSAVDVYAFGVTCVALLCAIPPVGLTRQPPVRPPLIDIETLFLGLPLEIPKLIYDCLAEDPAQRPNMEAVLHTIERQLLKDRHRALVYMNASEHWLHKDNRSIILKAGTIGRISIEYDGFDFKIGFVEGDVYLNNRSLMPGSIVPGCCVITFGSGKNRRFVTFDVSHPEVLV